MSSIPGNLIGSILQTTVVQGQAGAMRSADEAQKTNAERRQVAAADAHDSTVETTDNDTQVHTDAEGSGSQGRAFSEPEKKETEAEERPSNDVEGSHIDFEA